MATASAIAIALLAIPLLYAWATGAGLALYPRWMLLVPGLFAQAGIAEETLFRGYLFRHIRRGREFWPAAMLSMLPFVFVHLYMFVTMQWQIDLAATALAVVVSFPLAYLFELGGGTMWAPAIVHFIIQGAIKIIVVSDASGTRFPLLWMASSAILPFAVFFIPRKQLVVTRRTPADEDITIANLT